MRGNNTNTNHNFLRKCPSCDRPLSGKKQYCNQKCIQKAYRQRKEQGLVEKREVRVNNNSKKFKCIDCGKKADRYICDSCYKKFEEGYARQNIGQPWFSLGGELSMGGGTEQ